MNRTPKVLAAVISFILVLISGCDRLPSSPERDNPHDPGSSSWLPPRPFIYSVTRNPDKKIEVQWFSNTPYGVLFTVERKATPTGTYTVLGTVPGPAVNSGFVDATYPAVGFTYYYRVGTFGAAGGLTYSYDFPVDVF